MTAASPIFASSALFLCFLGACLFGVRAAGGGLATALFAVSFGVVAAFGVSLSPSAMAALLGVAVLCAAFLAPSALAAAALSGLFSGLAANAMQAHGADAVQSIAIAAALPLSAMLAVRFLPPRHTDALRHAAVPVGVALTALVIAAAPGVLEGWRAAEALNRSFDVAGGAPGAPAWIFALAIAAFAGGVVKGAYDRK